MQHDKFKVELREHNEELLKLSKESERKLSLAIVAVNDKGEKVLVFDNRMSASRYVLKEIQKESVKDAKEQRKKAMAIYGNLYHGLKNSWKVYGYYWKLIDTNAKNESDNQQIKDLTYPNKSDCEVSY